MLQNVFFLAMFKYNIGFDKFFNETKNFVYFNSHFPKLGITFYFLFNKTKKKWEM